MPTGDQERKRLENKFFGANPDIPSLLPTLPGTGEGAAPPLSTDTPAAKVSPERNRLEQKFFGDLPKAPVAATPAPDPVDYTPGHIKAWDDITSDDTWAKVRKEVDFYAASLVGDMKPAILPGGSTTMLIPDGEMLKSTVGGFMKMFPAGLRQAFGMLSAAESKAPGFTAPGIVGVIPPEEGAQKMSEIEDWLDNKFRIENPGIGDMIGSALGSMVAMWTVGLATGGPIAAAFGSASKVGQSVSMAKKLRHLQTLTGATMGANFESAVEQADAMRRIKTENPWMTHGQAWEASMEVYYKQIVPNIVLNLPLFAPSRKFFSVGLEAGSEGAQEGWQYIVQEQFDGRPLSEIVTDRGFYESIGVGMGVGGAMKTGLVMKEQFEGTPRITIEDVEKEMGNFEKQMDKWRKDIQDQGPQEQPWMQGQQQEQAPDSSLQQEQEVPGISIPKAAPDDLRRLEHLAGLLPSMDVAALEEIQRRATAAARSENAPMEWAEFAQMVQDEREKRAAWATKEAKEAGRITAEEAKQAGEAQNQAEARGREATDAYRTNAGSFLGNAPVPKEAEKGDYMPLTELHSHLANMGHTAEQIAAAPVQVNLDKDGTPMVKKAAAMDVVSKFASQPQAPQKAAGETQATENAETQTPAPAEKPATARPTTPVKILSETSPKEVEAEKKVAEAKVAEEFAEEKQRQKDFEKDAAKRAGVKPKPDTPVDKDKVFLLGAKVHLDGTTPVVTESDTKAKPKTVLQKAKTKPPLTQPGEEIPGLSEASDLIEFDASTRAQKNQMETLAEVDPNLAQDILAKKPVSVRRLKKALSLLQDAGDRKMDKWIRLGKKHGLPKTNLGGPMLVPPEVLAIQRTQNQIERQLANLEAGRQAGDPGSRTVPDISRSLSQSTAVADVIKIKSPELFERIKNNELLTKEEHAQVRAIAQEHIVELGARVDAAPKTGGRRRDAWKEMERARKGYQIIREQSAAINHNAKISAVRAKLLPKKTKGDVTLGVGFGGVQPIYDRLKTAIENGTVSPNWLKTGHPEAVARVKARIKARKRLTGPSIVGDGWTGVRKYLRHNWLRFYSHTVSENARGRSLIFDALKSRGVAPSDLNPLTSVISMLQLSKGWEGLTRTFLTSGITGFMDPDKKITAFGLEKILFSPKHQIAANWEMFNEYLVARRHVAVDVAFKIAKKKNPDRPLYYDPNSPADIKHIQDSYDIVIHFEAKHETWSEAAEEITAWNNGLLEYIKEAGLLSKAEFETLVEMFEFYVPLHVIASVGHDGKIIPGYGNRAGNPLKRQGKLQSDAIPIMPMETVVNRAHFMVKVALENHNARLMANMVDLYSAASLEEQEAGDGVWLGTRILQGVKPVLKSGAELAAAAKRDPEQVEEALVELIGEDVWPETIRQIMEIAGLDEQSMSLMHKLWVVNTHNRPGEISYLEDGKIHKLEVAPDIYEMFAGGTAKANDVLVDLMAKSAAMLRAGATSFSVNFPARNVFRDVGMAMIASRYLVRADQNIAADIVKFPLTMFKGFWSAVAMDDHYEKWLASLGGHSELVSPDMISSEKKMRGRLERGQGSLEFYVRNPLAAIQMFSLKMEQGTRVAIYRKTFDDLSTSGKWTRQEARFIAGLDSREGTTDFQRKGAGMQIARKVFPFFNANIQGNDRTIRSLVSPNEKNKKGAWAKGMLIYTVPAVLNWLMYNDEEWWQKEHRWKKHMFLIWSSDGGKTRFYQPLPHLAGFMFAVMPQLFLEHMKGEDPRALEKAIPYLADMVNPVGMGGFVGAMLEAGVNFSFFRQDNIVKGRKNEGDPGFQYTEKTSLVARELAKLFDDVPGLPDFVKSPQKLDHIGRGTFAGAGEVVAAVIDQAIAIAKPEYGRSKPAPNKVGFFPADWPVISGLFSAGVMPHTRYHSDYYEFLQESRRAWTSFEDSQKGKYPPEDLLDLLEDELFWIEQYELLSAASDDIIRITNSIKVIESKNVDWLTPDQKRQTLDALYKGSALAVESAVKAVEARRADKDAWKTYKDNKLAPLRAIVEARSKSHGK